MTPYFQEFGWKPYVLTTEDGTYPSIDPSLLNDVHPTVEVYRTKPKEVFSLYNRFSGNKGKSGTVGFIGMNQKSLKQRMAMYIRANYFVPDARMGWNKSALTKAKEIIESEKIDALITTGPPHSTHLLGLELKKSYGLKWIADLRDPWVNVYYNKIFPRTRRTIAKDQALENAVLNSADVISTVSQGLKQEFENRAKHIAVVYNGFEEEDFKHEAKKDSNKFTISYIGNFKPNQNVPVLWQALADLCLQNADFKQKLRLRLIGNIHPDLISSIEEAGLNEHLVISGFVSHKEAVELMKSSDRLLFIVPKTEGNKKILTGKLFEYLASETQLFSIGPIEGDAANILNECQRMPMIDYADLNMMKEMILQKRVNGVSDEYKIYSRKTQASKLIDLLKN
ncbi:MAG: glycosyltransferase [Bacteroidota bacterium]